LKDGARFGARWWRRFGEAAAGFGGAGLQRRRGLQDAAEHGDGVVLGSRAAFISRITSIMEETVGAFFLSRDGPCRPLQATFLGFPPPGNGYRPPVWMVLGSGAPEARGTAGQGHTSSPATRRPN
jgi:hypothetical protein